MSFTKQQADAIERLTAAVPTDEYIASQFPAFLESECQAEGRDIIELTAAERLSLKLEYEQALLAAVHPPDVIEAARLVQVRTKVVADLLMGAIKAKKVNHQGKPNVVFILAKDLRHLLEQAKRASG